MTGPASRSAIVLVEQAAITRLLAASPSFSTVVALRRVSGGPGVFSVSSGALTTYRAGRRGYFFDLGSGDPELLGTVHESQLGPLTKLGLAKKG